MLARFWCAAWHVITWRFRPGSGLGNLDRRRSKALARRLLLTDKSVEGSPQWTSDLSDWDLAPQFPTDFFTHAATRRPEDQVPGGGASGSID